MLAIIAGVLLVLWLLGFTAFHVTSGFIHILLVLAIVSILFHFFRGRAADRLFGFHPPGSFPA